MNGCTLCPRNCKALRTDGKKGFCGELNTVRVARAALHFWEEPCISGENGSGTVFFTGCTLRCVFCQNHYISTGNVGKEITIERLSDIFMELEAQGANNINLVTPTHFVPQIVEALKIAKSKGLSLPVVYNTSGYETIDTLKLLEGYVDVYLPDFKYLDHNHAKKYSMAEDYPEVAKQAIAEMVKQVGEPVFDENGMIKTGVIVRHLLLPGCLNDAKKIVEYLYHTYENKIYMSLMSQYTPLDTLDRGRFPELAKKVNPKMYDWLVDYAIEIGVEQAYIQEGDVAEESFIPSFQLEGV